ncbi:unnamed protein product [Linum tenue]|uniref:Uncharacterized protein n=1 Tax=Linum tenue TaxID=586396 RepID=A0AAV0JFU2_9ROSI|nr:unnamed protein product [Linum tenue]
MLLDEFEKLLECRVLKDEEIVSSCESLTFNSYLVDVADPEGHHVTVPGFRREIRRCRSVDLVSRLGRSSDVPLLILVVKVVCSSDFRKSELQKYEAPNNGKDTVTLGAAVWLPHIDAYPFNYQIQIKLYDASRNILSSRHLKKDERICSRESIAFGGYLVDVGKLEGDKQVLPGLNDENSPREIRKPDSVIHTSFRSSKSTLKGWLMWESHGNDLPRQDLSCSSPSNIERTKVAETVSATNLYVMLGRYCLFLRNHLRRVLLQNASTTANMLIVPTLRCSKLPLLETPYSQLLKQVKI